MSNPEPLIKLTRGVPPPTSFPTAQLSECAVAVLANHGDVVLQYGSSLGFPALRTLIAQEIGTDDGRVMIGQGSLQLLDSCTRALVQPGDIVYVEQPSYDRTLTILRRGGAKLVGFELEDDGPSLEEIEARLKSGEKPLFFYLIPDFQNPSGTVLSEAKRQRLVKLAQEYQFWIIEDLPYRKLRYRGQDLPTLFDLAPEQVIQMSSYSKLISPGLRVGYVVLPESLVSLVAKVSEDTYINASYLNQALVVEFIRRRWMEPQLTRLKALYEPRLDATLQALETHMADLATWHRPDGGFFVGTTLKVDPEVERLLRRAQEANLILTDGRGFFADKQGDTFVRLPFCALTPEQIEAGISRLARVVSELTS